MPIKKSDYMPSHPATIGLRVRRHALPVMLGLIAPPLVAAVLFHPARQTSPQSGPDPVKQVSAVSLRQIATHEVVVRRVAIATAKPKPKPRSPGDVAWDVLILVIGKSRPVFLSQGATPQVEVDLTKPISEQVESGTIQAAIIQEVVLRLTYGCDIDTLDQSRVKVVGKSITVTLPRPHVLGTPVVINQDQPVLDSKLRNKADQSAVPQLRQHVFAEAQQNGEQWLRDTGYGPELDGYVQTAIQRLLTKLVGDDYTVEVGFEREASSS